MTDFLDLPDLACDAVGGAALAANDEFFAEKENLIRDHAAVWKDHLYTDRGKWMDGWETRRRRSASGDGPAPGDHDWCIIRLGLPGVIRGVVVDTAFFRGNFPESCRLLATEIDDALDLAALDGATWTEVLPRTTLAGDTRNAFAVVGGRRATHVRLEIFPDGGVARLRVHGDVVPQWSRLRALGGPIDLAALEHGAVVETCSDMFFGARSNLIKPGPSRSMADGWETRRRRGPGHDWAIIRLAAAGTIEQLTVDTTHFRGNAPGRCTVEARSASTGGGDPDGFAGGAGGGAPRGVEARSASTGGGDPDGFAGGARGGAPRGVEVRSASTGGGDPDGFAGGAGGGAPRGIDAAVRDDVPAAAGDPGGAGFDDWRLLLASPLQPHTRHVFDAELRRIGPVSHLRLSVFPDGGVARLRALGTLVPDAAGPAAGLARLNALPADDARAALRRCCGATRWADAMAAARPFEDVPALLRIAERTWWALDEAAHREAFAAHPRIGETGESRAPASGDAAWSAGEQRGAATAGAAILAELADANRAYVDRHGLVFLVCATGRSADAMLAELRARTPRSLADELRTAAEEQIKITRLRLHKLLGELA